MANDIESTLTEGLLLGYAGKEVQPIERGGFTGKASHILIDQRRLYHDEWFVDSHIGGGQELIDIEGRKYTRLYAGGTPDPKQLESLGITTKDVSRYLKSQITKQGSSTRLFTDCTPEVDEDWQYNYQIRDTFEEIGLTTATETIEYKGTVVHIHTFILCPIK